MSHRLAAEAIIDTTVRLVKRSSLELAETVSRALSQLHGGGGLGFSAPG